MNARGTRRPRGGGGRGPKVRGGTGRGGSKGGGKGAGCVVVLLVGGLMFFGSVGTLVGLVMAR